MKSLLINVFSWAVFIALFSALACQAESLKELESVASKAKSRNDFLSKPELVGQYGKAVKASITKTDSAVKPTKRLSPN